MSTKIQKNKSLSNWWLFVRSVTPLAFCVQWLSFSSKLHYSHSLPEKNDFQPMLNNRWILFHISKLLPHSRFHGKLQNFSFLIKSFFLFFFRNFQFFFTFAQNQKVLFCVYFCSFFIWVLNNRCQLSFIWDQIFKAIVPSSASLSRLLLISQFFLIDFPSVESKKIICFSKDLPFVSWIVPLSPSFALFVSFPITNLLFILWCFSNFSLETWINSCKNKNNENKKRGEGRRKGKKVN